MKIDENRRVIFETEIVRLATPSSDFIDEALLSRLSSIEGRKI